MWIQNTSRYPDARVRELVAFAVRRVDMRRVCVNVKNGSLGGGAYNGVPEISNAPKRANYLVTLRLGRGGERWPLGPVNYHFQAPEEVGPRNRFPFFVCHDWQEWLVKLAAHEARHIEQFRAGERCSEISCERFAIAALEEFRAARHAAAASGPTANALPRRGRRAGRQEEAPLQLALPGLALES